MVQDFIYILRGSHGEILTGQGLAVPSGLRAYHCNRIEGFTALTGLKALQRGGLTAQQG